MSKTVVHTDNAPAAVGPYSQAIVANGMIFTAGQGGIVPGNPMNNDATIEEQTRQVMNNIKAILEEAGSSMDKVVKTTVFLKDMNDFSAMNAVYAEFFTETPPARSTVEVSRLPLDFLVEIEAIALV